MKKSKLLIFFKKMIYQREVDKLYRASKNRALAIRKKVIGR